MKRLVKELAGQVGGPPYPAITTSVCQNFCSRLSKLTVPVSLLGDVESDLSVGWPPSLARSMVLSKRRSSFRLTRLAACA